MSTIVTPIASKITEPSRRGFMRGLGTATLSAAALGLEHQAINAYQLGAESGLLEDGVLGVAVAFQSQHKGHADVLAGAAVYAQEHDVTPLVSDPFAASRARDVRTLIGCMERKRRYGEALAEADLDDLGELLGTRPGTREEGLAAFDSAIRE